MFFHYVFKPSFWNFGKPLILVYCIINHFLNCLISPIVFNQLFTFLTIKSSSTDDTLGSFFMHICIFSPHLMKRSKSSRAIVKPMFCSFQWKIWKFSSFLLVWEIFFTKLRKFSVTFNFLRAFYSEWISVLSSSIAAFLGNMFPLRPQLCNEVFVLNYPSLWELTILAHVMLFLNVLLDF